MTKIIEGNLEVKLPTIWTDESKGGKGQRRERNKKEDQRRKRQKTEGPGARKGRKVAKAMFFQCCVAPEDRKVGSLKRRVRSQLAR